MCTTSKPVSPPSPLGELEDLVLALPLGEPDVALLHRLRVVLESVLDRHWLGLARAMAMMIMTHQLGEHGLPELAGSDLVEAALVEGQRGPFLLFHLLDDVHI